MKQEKLNSKTIEIQNFYIEDETMGALISDANRIMKNLSENVNKMSRNEINEHTSSLENIEIGFKRGIEERVELYKKIKGLSKSNDEYKKKIEEIELVLEEAKDLDIDGFLNDFNNKKGNAEVEAIIAASDDQKQGVQATIEETTDNQETQTTEVVTEEVSDEIKSYRYTSIIPQIRDFKARIKKDMSDELKEEILSFVAEYEKKITYRKSVMDTDTDKDFVSKEYNGIKRALTDLKALKESVQPPQTTEEIQQIDSKKDNIEEEMKPEATSEENTSQPYDTTESYRQWGENFAKLTDDEKAVFIKSFTPRAANLEEDTEKTENPEVNKDDVDNRDNEEAEEVEEFTSYESVIDSIIKNKSPLAREIFLNKDDHRSMIQDLKKQMISIVNKEGAESLNAFITTQQENIKKLIELVSTHGSVDKNLLLNALRSDLDFLEESRTKIKAKVEKKIENRKPETDSEDVVENTESEKVDTTETEKPEEKEDSENNNLFSEDQMNIIELYPKLKTKLFKAIDDYNRSHKKDPNSEITKECLKDIDTLLKEIENKHKTQIKKEIKKDTEPSLEEWAGYGIIDINDPEQPLYISYKSMIIMKSKPGFYEKVQDVINKHNENIRNKASREVLDASMIEIEETQNEFQTIEKEWQDKIDTDLQNEKKKGKKGKKTEESKATEVNEPTPEVEPEAVEVNETTPETQPETDESAPEVENESEARIFYTEEGKDYHEISNNILFNSWLEGIEKSILKYQYSIESEIKSLDDWYNEYQEDLPYIEKLNTVFEDIKKEKREDKTKLLALRNKTAELAYEIHTSGKTAKDKIDFIFKQYEESIALSQKRAELKKSIELATKIKKERKIGENERELSSGQVKSILESRGSVNTEKNIEDMLDFLRDMQKNYVNLYSNKKESVENDMSKIYSRYNINQKKKGFFSTILFSIPGSRLFIKESPVEYQNLKNLILKLRDLNLVDRKNGDEDSKNDNEARMDDLISFTSGQIELLIEHIQNPKSNKAETLDEKQKETLKIFDTLYKTFIESKYSSKDAIKEAEDFLASNKDLSRQLDSMDEDKDIMESIYDDKYELATFEHEAKSQIAREELLRLKDDISKFPKTGKNINQWTKMNNKFTELEKTFEELGEDMENDLDIKTTRLLLEDLTIRHINKEVYKDLSANFAKYENIINSPDRTVEEKKVYLKDLLSELKKHRTKKTNTKVQNGVLDDTIKRYEKILKDIK